MGASHFFIWWKGGVKILAVRRMAKPPRRPTDVDLVNDNIRFSEVLLIGAQGEQLGIKSRVEALSLAKQEGLDLLCVAPKARPPVCKIIDYGKHKFEKQKKEKEAKKKQKTIDIKEVQLSPNIGEHDYQTKLKAGRKFLENGDKVKISIRFKGRQMAFTEKGLEVIKRFVEDCAELAQIEKEPVLDGRTMIGVIAPIKKKGEKKHEEQNEK